MSIPGRDPIQLPADGVGKQLDAYAYQFYDAALGQTVTRYAQAALLVDQNGNPLSSGGRLPTQDDSVRGLLEKILLELRITNEQLAVVTGRGQLEYPENQRGF